MTLLRSATWDAVKAMALEKLPMTSLMFSREMSRVISLVAAVWSGASAWTKTIFLPPQTPPRSLTISRAISVPMKPSLPPKAMLPVSGKIVPIRTSCAATVPAPNARAMTSHAARETTVFIGLVLPECRSPLSSDVVSPAV